MRHKEQDIQMNLVQYIRLRYPDILFTISGAGLIRNKRTGGLMKKLGYSAGCPDIMIFEPRGDFKGLFIELKQEKGHPTPEQRKWIEDLNKRGYLAQILYGFEQTKKFIDEYLVKEGV